LHAEHLVVIHPITKKRLDLRAPLPADFLAVLQHLRDAAGVQTEAARPRKIKAIPGPHTRGARDSSR